MKGSQVFYESTYSTGHEKKQPKGFLGKLYLLFKKLESYREDVVYKLLPEGNRYLDIGCGEGKLVFRALVKYLKVYGIDITRTRIDVALKKKNKLSKEGQSRVKLLVADADKKLPFKPNFFDCITMVAALEHFFDPYRIIRETRRILKKDGIVIIQVPNLGFLPRRVSILFGKLPITSEDEMGWDGGHLHYFTISALSKFLKEEGFKIEKITCSGVFARLRRWWVSLLGADIIIAVRKR